MKALWEEIKNDPEKRGYSKMKADKIADDLNEKRYVGDYPATVLTIASTLGIKVSDSLADSMELAAKTQGTVREVLHLLRNGHAVNIGNPVTREILDTFGKNKTLPLTVEQANAIKALAENMKSRSEILRLGKVAAGTVERVM